MKKWNHTPHEPHRFRLTLATKLNVEDPNKSMALANVSIITHRKTLRFHIATINLKYLLHLGMMNLICLMDHILFCTFKIILSTLTKNMKL